MRKAQVKSFSTLLQVHVLLVLSVAVLVIVIEAGQRKDGGD